MEINFPEMQGCSQHFQIGGSKFIKSAQHSQALVGKAFSTLCNERHLVHVCDYSHYIVKMKLLATCAS